MIYEFYIAYDDEATLVTERQNEIRFKNDTDQTKLRPLLAIICKEV